MSVKQIDILNIGLVLLSAILAYIFPLELFILAFAILGPLHYLTEINWLDKKEYFAGNTKRTWLWIGTALTLLIVGPKFFFEYADLSEGSLKNLHAFNNWTNAFIAIAFVLSIAFVFFKRMAFKIGVVLLGLLLALLLNSNEHYIASVGLFIPTVIHVYLFTLLFMLFGAKKSKSTWGFIAVLSALLIPVLFVVLPIDASNYIFGIEMKTAYAQNNFHLTPTLFGKYLGLSDGTQFSFESILDLRLMMFIAFIYTYHYLNWFSKTSLIAWHKTLTRKRTVAIALVWIIMLVLFYLDFRLGFLVSLFFSILHVILEFPLNMVSIRGVFSRGNES